MTVAAILVGAAVGAGVSYVTGGDPMKGAMYGAVGGGIGGGYAIGGAAPSAEFGAAAIGGAKGGAIGGAGSTLVGGLGAQVLKTPAIPPPGPTTIQAPYASEAERQRRRRRKDYGSTILTGGLGTTATTRRIELGP